MDSLHKHRPLIRLEEGGAASSPLTTFVGKIGSACCSSPLQLLSLDVRLCCFIKITFFSVFDSPIGAIIRPSPSVGLARFLSIFSAFCVSQLQGSAAAAFQLTEFISKVLSIYTKIRAWLHFWQPIATGKQEIYHLDSSWRNGETDQMRRREKREASEVPAVESHWREESYEARKVRQSRVIVGVH